MSTARTLSASQLHVESRRRSEAGFTLIETSVVVLIIGILVTLAIPTFLGARTRAEDADARSNLRTALTAGIASSDIRSDFRTAADDDLTAYEPSLSYVDELAPSTGPKSISVDATESDRWVAVVRSNSGTCFAVVAGPYGQTATDGGSCVAADITLAPPDFVRRTVTHNGPVTAVTPGMCLEAVAGGYIQQQPCNGTQPGITVNSGSDGYSTLSLGSESCFGTTGTNRGARVLDEPCDGGDDQLWEVIPSYQDTVQFKNKETGYCLDVYGASSSAGANLISWGYGDSPNGTCKPTTSANNHNFGLS